MMTAEESEVEIPLVSLSRTIYFLSDQDNQNDSKLAALTPTRVQKELILIEIKVHGTNLQ